MENTNLNESFDDINFDDDDFLEELKET